jgi:inner membrane protein
MPLPIGHALAGIACQQARPGFFLKNRWLDAAVFVILANLPDGDFLPGFLQGFPNRYHHGIFHSFGAMLLVSAAITAVFFRRKKKPFGFFTMVFSVLASHLVLDFLTLDFTPPYGLPLFWPLSSEYFIDASPIFSNITRSSHSADFFSSLFSRHNLKAALLEIGILGGAILLVAAARSGLAADRRRRAGRTAS